MITCHDSPRPTRSPNFRAMYWSSRSDVSADRANTNGPTCSFRTYRLIIFTVSLGGRVVDSAELQALHRVVRPCPACIFHPPPARIQGFLETRQPASRERTRAGPRHEPSAASYPTVRVWCDPCILRRELFSIALAVGLAWRSAGEITDAAHTCLARPAAGGHRHRSGARRRLPGRPSRVSSCRSSSIFASRARRSATGTSCARRSRRFRSSAVSGCNAGFLPWSLQPTVSIKSSGVIADRWHVNVDYDMQREFDASNSLSLYYEGTPGSRLAARRRRQHHLHAAAVAISDVDRCRAGNYGLQITNQFGPLRFQSIFAQQTGNIGQIAPVHDRHHAHSRRAAATSTTTRSNACASSSRSIPRCSAAAVRSRTSTF